MRYHRPFRDVLPYLCPDILKYRRPYDVARSDVVYGDVEVLENVLGIHKSIPLVRYPVVGKQQCAYRTYPVVFTVRRFHVESYVFHIAPLLYMIPRTRRAVKYLCLSLGHRSAAADAAAFRISAAFRALCLLLPRKPFLRAARRAPFIPTAKADRRVKTSGA